MLTEASTIELMWAMIKSNPHEFSTHTNQKKQCSVKSLTQIQVLIELEIIGMGLDIRFNVFTLPDGRCCEHVPKKHPRDCFSVGLVSFCLYHAGIYNGDSIIFNINFLYNFTFRKELFFVDKCQFLTNLRANLHYDGEVHRSCKKGCFSIVIGRKCNS